MLFGEGLLLLMSFFLSKERLYRAFVGVVVHSVASRCQCFSVCGDFKEVEVQQRLLHCLNQGTGSGSTALLAVIPSSSLPLPGSLAQSSAMASTESLLSGSSLM